ncbi:unnamed protein product [Bursaphelenchus okinawaensis]|uniref:G_PROTEIN_RECEP_F1_2 domain-containing protein n=1 Tax=Bursaphelenchus okinawaensis TaxID=465554 RepID=A0A811LN98_9BILA|nr:unnamed protein product [Bursaphelenchus okinawaensis]CAG9125878.1 unnamed protein product [Bursaphelenchus okinawaensis]
MLCRVISQLFDSNWSFRFLLLVQFFFASFSLICLVCLGLLLSLWRCYTLHTRLMLLSFLAAFLFADIGVLLTSVYQLQVLLFRPLDSRCYWFSYTYKDCHALRLLFNISAVAIFTSSTVFTLKSLLIWGLKLKKNSKKYLTLALICIHWVVATVIGLDVNGFFDKSVQPKVHQPHCSALVPTPTQFRSLFFPLMTLHIFTLFVYTFFVVYINRKKILKRLEKVNKVLYENVTYSEVTFPLVCVTVTLYVTSIVLDDSFLRIILSLFGQDYSNSSNFSQILWYETQTAVIPLASLLVFGILIKKIWPQNDVEYHQETLARTIDGGYDQPSDALSFHSLEGTLKCNKDVRQQCADICAKIPQHTSPSISTFLSSDSSVVSQKTVSSPNVLRKEHTMIREGSQEA